MDFRSLSPTACPSVSFIALNPSKSRNMTATFGVAGRSADGLLHAIRKQHAIRQSRQKIVLRGVRHLQRDGLGGGQIAERDNRSTGASRFILKGSDGIFDGNFDAVSPLEDTVRESLRLLAFPYRSLIFTRLGMVGIHHVKDFCQWTAHSFMPRPSGHFFLQRH